MNAGEDLPIGIILCAEKDQETVSLLELDKSGIYVAVAAEGSAGGESAPSDCEGKGNAGEGKPI